jgi:hypothetical protein
VAGRRRHKTLSPHKVAFQYGMIRPLASMATLEQVHVKAAPEAARSDLFATSVENPAAGTHVLGRLPKSGIISTSPASRGSKRGSAG